MSIVWLAAVIMIAALALRDGPDWRQLPADWEPTKKTIIRSNV
jgi:transposase